MGVELSVARLPTQQGEEGQPMAMEMASGTKLANLVT